MIFSIYNDSCNVILDDDFYLEYWYGESMDKVMDYGELPSDTLFEWFRFIIEGIIMEIS